MCTNPSNQLYPTDTVSAAFKANLEMLTIMHSALHKICRSDISLDGGIAMKGIAADALLAAEKIATSIEDLIDQRQHEVKTEVAA